MNQLKVVLMYSTITAAIFSVIVTAVIIWLHKSGRLNTVGLSKLLNRVCGPVFLLFEIIGIWLFATPELVPAGHPLFLYCMFGMILYGLLQAIICWIIGGIVHHKLKKLNLIQKKSKKSKLTIEQQMANIESGKTGNK